MSNQTVKRISECYYSMIIRKCEPRFGGGVELQYSTRKHSIFNVDLTLDHQLMTIEDMIPQLRDKEYHFTVVPKDIMYMHNGIRYYYVEVHCVDDDRNFMVNAHGSDAERLFKAVNSIRE